MQRFPKTIRMPVSELEMTEGETGVSGIIRQNYRKAMMYGALAVCML
jgi:hypothetical protein